MDRHNAPTTCYRESPSRGRRSPELKPELTGREREPFDQLLGEMVPLSPCGSVVGVKLFGFPAWFM
jgi:hypothetical protein